MYNGTTTTTSYAMLLSKVLRLEQLYLHHFVRRIRSRELQPKPSKLGKSLTTTWPPRPWWFWTGATTPRARLTCTGAPSCHGGWTTKSNSSSAKGRSLTGKNPSGEEYPLSFPSLDPPTSCPITVSLGLPDGNWKKARTSYILVTWRLYSPSMIQNLPDKCKLIWHLNHFVF